MPHSLHRGADPRAIMASHATRGRTIWTQTAPTDTAPTHTAPTQTAPTRISLILAARTTSEAP